MNPEQTFTNGLVGVISSTLGVLSTFQEQLDYGVRVSGGILFLVISCISLYRLIKPSKP
jgi:hypothetical protein